MRVAEALMQRSLTPPKSILQNATAERVRKLLEKAPLFRVLDEQGRDELATHAQSRTFAANQSIFRVGETGHCMMGVVVGIVRISVPTRKGRDLILADLPAGEFFGEIALLDGEPRSASATALTNCELLVLDRRDMLPFLERSPTACLNSCNSSPAGFAVPTSAWPKSLSSIYRRASPERYCVAGCKDMAR